MEQNYKNHVRFVPMFHYFVLPVLLINFVSSVIVAKHNFSADTVIASVTALALILLALFRRVRLR